MTTKTSVRSARDDYRHAYENRWRGGVLSEQDFDAAMDELDVLRSRLAGLQAIEGRDPDHVHPAGPADDRDWVAYCQAANAGWNLCVKRIREILVEAQ